MNQDPASPSAPAPLVRVGIIGTDSSHSVEFAKLLNDSTHPRHVPGARVVAAYKGGSADMPERSLARIDGFATELVSRHGVRCCNSVEEVMAAVDALLIENVDGRAHLPMARRVFPSRKPVFIDKPLGGTLAEGVAIVELAARHGTPFFSASALRFAPALTRMAAAERAALRWVTTFCPCETEPHHPDLFWYGVHGVELLYALLGTGCEAVSRTHTPETDVVTGRWRNGRVGVYCGARGAAPAFGFRALVADRTAGEDIVPDYAPLVREIVRFFHGAPPPVSTTEMLEVLAFMEAADASKHRHGAPVPLPLPPLNEA